MRRNKIILIVGAGRSGSTVMDQVLGQIPGVISTGEINYFWDGAVRDGHLCSCSKNVINCEFWGGVIKEVYSKVRHQDLNGIVALKQSVDRRECTFLHAYKKFRSNKFKKTVNEYLQIMRYFYESIFRNSFANVIVDSSKDPAHALLLYELDIADIYIIHLIRDPRGVAYSRSKQKKITSRVDKHLYMRKQNVFEVAFKWSIVNYFCSHYLSNKMPYMRVRYEDFVNHPKNILTNIEQLLSTSFNLTNIFDSNSSNKIYLKNKSHIVHGNPGRSNKDFVVLSSDDEWTEKSSIISRVVIRGLCGLQMMIYGYK